MLDLCLLNSISADTFWWCISGHVVECQTCMLWVCMSPCYIPTPTDHGVVYQQDSIALYKYSITTATYHGLCIINKLLYSVD